MCQHGLEQDPGCVVPNALARARSKEEEEQVSVNEIVRNLSVITTVEESDGRDSSVV